MAPRRARAGFSAAAARGQHVVCLLIEKSLAETRDEKRPHVDTIRSQTYSPNTSTTTFGQYSMNWMVSITISIWNYRKSRIHCGFFAKAHPFIASLRSIVVPHSSNA
jgi:hypothetical protein